MNRDPIKENEFFPAPGGNSGTVNYQSGYGTFSSPEVSQSPAHFASSNANKAIGSNSNTAKTGPDSGSMAADVNAIYSKKDAPTPDDVIAGINYEMGQQIKKDKAEAKRIVISNLKKDPKYYSNLHMLNADDDAMVNTMDESKNEDEQMKKIFLELSEKKGKKYVVNSHISDIMKNMWDKKHKK